MKRTAATVFGEVLITVVRPGQSDNEERQYSTTGQRTAAERSKAPSLLKALLNRHCEFDGADTARVIPPGKNKLVCARLRTGLDLQFEL